MVKISLFAQKIAFKNSHKSSPGQQLKMSLTHGGFVKIW
jgi:hypothetical protein